MFERYYLYPAVAMMKLKLTLNHISIRMKRFLNYTVPKMIQLNFLKNVTIYLFKYFVSHIMTYISILQNKSEFLVLHNFTKCFSGTRVNQIVIINIWMVNFLIFSICYFRLGKKERMIIDNNIFKIVTLPDNLVLI